MDLVGTNTKFLIETYQSILNKGKIFIKSQAKALEGISAAAMLLEGLKKAIKDNNIPSV